MNFTIEDAGFMRRALALARRGLGNVEPNPMVGAVVVREGRVVGEGYHRLYGEWHAEVVALREAGRKAQGATIYVTLEPCCHWGKTPPCTDAVLAAGIKRVVVAMVDPFAQVKGKGIRLLRRAGVTVDVGLMEEEARELNKVFLTRVREGRPFVIAKWAQSVDGCIATAAGESKWISSEESRAWVQVLRGRMDGIVVGIGTVLADDPLLMARPARGRDIKRLATRIVLDSQCRLPVESQLVKTIYVAPLLVVHAKKLSREGEKRKRVLESRGVMMKGVGVDKAGRVKVGEVLRYLGAMEYANVLVEGGGEVHGAFFRAGVVDEVHLFVAPVVIGGRHARHAVGGEDLRRLADAQRMRVVGVEGCGGDVHVVLRSR